ncbi:MAG: PspC domain-containing protein [Dehalococcoidia bacterium]|nr:PspC domain-containing protein [Dehalococcoidia bacterium]
MTNETDHPEEQPTAPEPTAAAPNTDDAPAPPPPTEPQRARRLTRSRRDDWFGGVAGGLAEYFDTDPTLIRILFVIAAIVTSGFAIVAYIVAWIVIPEEGAEEGEEPGVPRRRRHRHGGLGAIIWGGILIIGGTIVLLAQLDLDIDLPPFEVGLSAALILVGLLILVEARHGFHGGLMTLATILIVLLGLSSASRFNVAVDGAFGDARHHVTRASDLDREYSHAFGSLTVDLRDLDLNAGTTHLEVSVLFGDGTLYLPADVPYRIEADSVFGSIDATEFDTEGVATSRTYTSPGYDEAPTRLDIDMSVVFGSGRVR